MKRLIPKGFHFKAARILPAVVLVMGISVSPQAGTLASPPMLLSVKFENGTIVVNRLSCLVANLSLSDLLVSVKIMKNVGGIVDTEVFPLEPGDVEILTSPASSNPFGLTLLGYCRFDVLDGPASSVKASACEHEELPLSGFTCIDYLEATEIPSAGGFSRVPDGVFNPR